MQKKMEDMVFSPLLEWLDFGLWMIFCFICMSLKYRRDKIMYENALEV